MAQAKYTIYKYVRSERGSRFGSVRVALKSHPALSQTRTAERHSTPIAHQARCRGGRRREKKHPEGNHDIACSGKWIPVEADALTAQRQQHGQCVGTRTASTPTAWSPQSGRRSENETPSRRRKTLERGAGDEEGFAWRHLRVYKCAYQDGNSS